MIISSDMGIDVMLSILKEQMFRYNILHTDKGFFETFYIINTFFEST